MKAMKIFKEHQLLLIRRENRAVVGQKAVNLWLLVAVLFATFLAISFSAGSMAYLADKMNDPFTNWVNITRKGGNLEAISKIRPVLEADSTLSSRFMYDDVQTEITESRDMVSVTGMSPLFSVIFYEDLHSDLIEAVLSSKNVVGNMSVCPDSIDNHSMGVVMTLDALYDLGYTQDNIPAFVDCHEIGQYVDSLGFDVVGKLSGGDAFVRAPLPLLAVVKRLPMNMEMLASKYLREQFQARSLNMNKEDYARKLRFFVPADVGVFNKEGISHCVPDSLKTTVYVTAAEDRIQRRFASWRKGQIVTVDVGWPGTPLPVINAIERGILHLFAGKGVQRMYDYKEDKDNCYFGQNGRSGTDDDVISVRFARLDSIRSFEQFVKDVSEGQLQIEMTQVKAKENFKAVSSMAGVLTVALLLFSIVSITIFIVNMMQSYFQKVKRNLGTFKAFGISTRELVMVYVAIIVGIVVAALVIALAATWAVELLLWLFAVTKEGGAPHLILWNGYTLLAIAIILVSTVVSVLIVMLHLLRRTPGDLIYDRE